MSTSLSVVCGALERFGGAVSEVLLSASCGSLSALLFHLKKLVSADRALSVKLLVHLGELDDRGVCRAHGYASTFEYAVRALHMSGAEADLRIQAARLGRRFPRVLELFGQGELHLTAITLLGPILTGADA